jgi:hypothetical protein
MPQTIHPTDKLINDFEERLNLFGYGKKKNIITIMRSLRAENESLKKALEQAQLESTTKISDTQFEFLTNKEGKKVLHIKEDLLKKIETVNEALDEL